MNKREVIDNLKIVMQSVAKLRGMGEIPVVEFDTEETSLCDPTVEIDGSGIGITVFMTGSNGKLAHPTYAAYTTTVIPGCYRTANGDGWPDDVDIDELGEEDTCPALPVKLILDAYVKFVDDMKAEYEAEEAMAKELEEAEAYAEEYRKEAASYVEFADMRTAED